MNSILEDRTYSAVKAYALKGTLIDQATYTSLAESKSIDELIIKLKTTTYNEFISQRQILNNNVQVPINNTNKVLYNNIY